MKKKKKIEKQVDIIDSAIIKVIKGALSCLRQILTTGSPLNLMKKILFHLESSYSFVLTF